MEEERRRVLYKTVQNRNDKKEEEGNYHVNQSDTQTQTKP